MNDLQQLSHKYNNEHHAQIWDWVVVFLENPKQLQQICREVTRQTLLAHNAHKIRPAEKIQTLPVPPKVKLYLNFGELDSMAQ